MTATGETDGWENDKEIIKLRKEKAAHQKMIADSIAIVKEGLNAKETIEKEPSSFFLYNSIPDAFVNASYLGEWNGKKMYFGSFEYFTSVRTGRTTSEGRDEYLFGVISLKEAYPHIVIKPELLALKIEDLFTKMDVDFKHARLFSFLYYVITKDKNALKFKFQSKELNRIAKFLNAEIEFIGHECFFRVNRTAISPKQAERFVKLAKVLAEVF